MIPGALAAWWMIAPAAAAPPAMTAHAVAAESMRVVVLPEIEIRAERVAAAVLLPFRTATFSREEIERRPEAHLADLLEIVAGVRVASRGLGSSSVSIRGSTTDQVIVVRDGRRISPAQGGGADLAALALDTAESVEVVRGGASALWGGDALGGIVHVRGRPARPGYRARLGAGSFGEQTAEADAGFRLGRRWAMRGSARLFSTDGSFPFDEDAEEARHIVNGDLRRASAEWRADGVAGPAGVTADAAYSDEDRGVPGPAEFPTPHARLRARRWSAAARVTDLDEGWRTAADVSLLRQTHRYRDDRAAFGPIDDEHENTRARIETSLGRGRGTRGFEAAFGAISDRLESTTDGSRRRDGADLRVVAARDVRWGGRSMQCLGAARVDAIRGWKSVVSPRLGVTVPLHSALRLSGSAGTAFRVPSFDELFWAPRGSAAGNPDLRIERGRDVDAGLALEAGSVSAGATAFLRDVDGLIQWLPGPDGVWRPRNLGRAVLWGVEADGRAAWALSATQRAAVTISGTWLRGEDRTGEPNADGLDLVYRPRWTGALSLRWMQARTGEFEAVARAVDDVFVTRANTKTLPGYLVIDLRWRRPLGKGLRADASLSNVGDVQARDFRDDPLPGRSVSAGLTWEGGRS